MTTQTVVSTSETTIIKVVTVDQVRMVGDRVEVVLIVVGVVATIQNAEEEGALVVVDSTTTENSNVQAVATDRESQMITRTRCISLEAVVEAVSRGVDFKAVARANRIHQATTQHLTLLSQAVELTQFTKAGESTTTKTLSTSSKTEFIESVNIKK